MRIYHKVFCWSGYAPCWWTTKGKNTTPDHSATQHSLNDRFIVIHKFDILSIYIYLALNRRMRKMQKMKKRGKWRIKITSKLNNYYYWVRSLYRITELQWNRQRPNKHGFQHWLVTIRVWNFITLLTSRAQTHTKYLFFNTFK